MIINNQQNKLNFIKMSALGNDFVIFDYRQQYFSLNSKQILEISNRKNIGCDQLIIIKKPNQNNSQEIEIDVEMEIFNCDGSISPTCGNATRCVAGYLFEENPHKKIIVIQTLGGILNCQKINENLISVNMGKAKFLDNLNFDKYIFNCVDVGNPHAVCFVDKMIDNKDFLSLGPQIENHQQFPNKTNVEFAQIINDQLIAVRVWERGVGETMACGSGACGVAALAIKNKFVNSSKVLVEFTQGRLQIEYINDEIIMIGDYQKIFYGKIDEDFFS
jgi:diaminopimelate epimerase